VPDALAQSRFVCAGVYFGGGGDRLTLTPSGNVLVDSTVMYPERLTWTYNPAATLDTGGVLAHCELAHAPHFALTLQGNDIWVQGNVIHHTTQVICASFFIVCSSSACLPARCAPLAQYTFDTAAMYYYHQDWSMYNLTVINNFFYLNGLGVSTCNGQTSCNRDAIYPDNG
jgi:hypothetical protein